VAIDRKSYDYQPKRAGEDETIAKALVSLAQQHPRHGFKKCFDLLRLAGQGWNHKRVYRIYCELQLNLRIKPKKRLAPRTKKTLAVPETLNSCWSLDYMSDVLMNGLRFRTANVIDDANREALGIAVSRSLPARKITAWLDRLAARNGYPRAIRVDNGPENLSRHFVSWAALHNIKIIYIQPGKPAQNAYIERFNRTYREDILDMYLFESVEHVTQLTNEWLIYYNENRPHQALEALPPKAYAQKFLGARL